MKTNPAAVMAPVVAAVVVGVAFWGFSYDDAYITYRYAANFAAGDGLVFNVGERVLGTTAPGYAVLLGVLSMLGPSPVAWGTLLGLAGLLAAAWSPWLLPRQRRPPDVWVGLWGVSLMLARWHLELLGAETLPVLGAACLAGALALGPRRYLAAGLLAALAASLRFDAVFVCGVLGLALWLRDRKFPWRYFFGTLPAGLAVLGVTAYFGSPLPQTLAGKRGEFVDREASSYSAQEWGWLVRDFGGVGAAALLVLAVVGCVRLARPAESRGWRHPLVLAAFGWALAVEVFYRAVHVPFAPWYHVMTVALLLALACWAGVGLARLAAGRRLRAVVASALLLPVLWTSLAFLATRFRQPPDPRWQIYRQIGEFLARQTEPGSVAMVEIGVAAYYAPRHDVLDLVGLASPVAAAHGAEEAMRRVRPRYVVDPSLFHGRFPVLARLSEPRWRLLRSFADPASGRGVVRVWESRSESTAESPRKHWNQTDLVLP